MQVDNDTDDLIVDFAYFSGGTAECAPNHDCYARVGRIRYASVEDAQPIPPEPAPDEDITYTIVGGEITLRRKSG
jgi:hypothetical protein